MNKPVNSNPSTQQQSRLSALLERSKPYREAIGVLMAVLVAISGAVSWLVAHFATQAALHLMECRVTNATTSQLLSIRMEEYTARHDELLAEIQEVANQALPDSVKRINYLILQIEKLDTSHASAIKGVQNALDHTSKQCIQDTPEPSN